MELPQFSPADQAAIIAVNNGQATPEQQKRCMWYIINIACQTYDKHWRSDPHMTDLALGQALPGQHLVAIMKAARSTENPDKISLESIGTEPRKDERI